MKIALILFVALVNIPLASAAMISYSDSVVSFYSSNTLGVNDPDSQNLPITTTTTRTGAYSLPFFDSSFGKLNQVIIQVDQTPDLRGTGFCNDDLNPNPDPFRNLCRHQGSGSLVHDFSLALGSLNESAGPDAGGLGFTTESTIDWRVDNAPLTIGTTLSDTYTFSGTDILEFINLGMFDLDFSLNATSTMISATSTTYAQLQAIARLNGNAMVTYEYNPVPIPATFWLFGTALIGFVGVSRRRKVA